MLVVWLARHFKYPGKQGPCDSLVKRFIAPSQHANSMVATRQCIPEVQSLSMLCWIFCVIFRSRVPGVIATDQRKLQVLPPVHSVKLIPRLSRQRQLRNWEDDVSFHLSEVPERPGKGDEAWNFFNVFFLFYIFAWKSDKVLRYLEHIKKMVKTSYPNSNLHVLSLHNLT